MSSTVEASAGGDGHGGGRWTPLIAGLLVLGASFGNFLAHHGYPLLRPEVVVVAAVLIVAALVFASVYRWAWNFGRTVLEALLTFLAVDLNSDWIPAAAIAAAVVAVLRLHWRLSVLKPLSIVAAVVLASSATGLAEHRPGLAVTPGKATAASARPAVLHLILDEHGGLGAIRDPVAKRQIADFYTSRGFRLFERAYSRHFRTVNAVPDTLNFGRPGERRKVADTLGTGRAVYLDGLARQGYRLHVYQSEYVDFCRYFPNARCTRYWSPSLGFIDDQPFPILQKARLIGAKFAALSGSLVGLAALIDGLTRLPATDPLGLPVLAPKERALSTSLAALALLDRMAPDLAAARPGDAYFAHLLAPHYPYVVDADCRMLPPSHWEFRRSSRPIEDRRRSYHRQLGCVMRKIDRLAAAFLASPGGKDGVIIIHGDHGSRIAELDPNARTAAKLSADDLMAGYATLFAVRGPGLPPGIDGQAYAVPQILERLASTGFRSADGMAPGDGIVYLDGPGWTVGAPVSINNAWP